MRYMFWKTPPERTILRRRVPSAALTAISAAAETSVFMNLAHRAPFSTPERRSETISSIIGRQSNTVTPSLA